MRQNDQERNFHAFYNLLVGGSAAQYGLTGNPMDYFYTRQGGAVTAPGIDDKADWVAMKAAFDNMQFSAGQQRNVETVLAAILHLGNLTFVTAGGAQVENRDVAGAFAKLLEVDVDGVVEVVTNITRVVHGETIATPLDVNQAADARDSMAMSLYVYRCWLGTRHMPLVIYACGYVRARTRIYIHICIAHVCVRVASYCDVDASFVKLCFETDRALRPTTARQGFVSCIFSLYGCLVCKAEASSPVMLRERRLKRACR